MTAITSTAASHSLHLRFFFFNDTATTEIYTLSLHDALPICRRCGTARAARPRPPRDAHRSPAPAAPRGSGRRSEEHTSELQSQSNLVCRLLLEKKKKSAWREVCMSQTRCREPNTCMRLLAPL